MAESTSSDAATHVSVLGAGIVGVCCALYLQRNGLRVTLVDPETPGDGASFGNAGFIAPGSCTPVGMPGLAAKLVFSLVCDPVKLMDYSGNTLILIADRSW